MVCLNLFCYRAELFETSDEAEQVAKVGFAYFQHHEHFFPQKHLIFPCCGLRTSYATFAALHYLTPSPVPILFDD